MFDLLSDSSFHGSHQRQRFVVCVQISAGHIAGIGDFQENALAAQKHDPEKHVDIGWVLNGIIKYSSYRGTYAPSGA